MKLARFYYIIVLILRTAEDALTDIDCKGYKVILPVYAPSSPLQGILGKLKGSEKSASRARKELLIHLNTCDLSEPDIRWFLCDGPAYMWPKLKAPQIIEGLQICARREPLAFFESLNYFEIPAEERDIMRAPLLEVALKNLPGRFDHRFFQLDFSDCPLTKYQIMALLLNHTSKARLLKDAAALMEEFVEWDDEKPNYVTQILRLYEFAWGTSPEVFIEFYIAMAKPLTMRKPRASEWLLELLDPYLARSKWRRVTFTRIVNKEDLGELFGHVGHRQRLIHSQTRELGKSGDLEVTYFCIEPVTAG